MSASTDRSELGPGLHVAQAAFIFLAYPWILLRNRLGLLKPLESAVLAEVLERLDQATGDIARSQLAQINRVLRVTAGRTECNLFRVAPFRVVFDRELTFPFAESEQPLVTMHFQVSSGAQHVVKVFVVRGNLFSLEFGKDVRHLLHERIQAVTSFKQHVTVDG